MASLCSLLCEIVFRNVFFSRYLFENLPKSMQGGFLRVINFLTGYLRLEMF